jgi:hypothetical protein
MKRKEDFEQFLMLKHAEAEPQVLDDDGPDAYEAWLEDVDGNELIEYAEEYGKEQYQAGVEAASVAAQELIKEKFIELGIKEATK